MSPVPSDHRFDDPGYVRQWAESVNSRRPDREAVFARVADELAAAERAPRRVLELGSGPGMLAEWLLDHVATVEEYTLFDLSEPMHDLARERLGPHTARCAHVVGDFLDDRWPLSLRPRYDAVVSTQAVHELRDASLIPGLYARLRAEVIAPGATVLVADKINLPGTSAAHFLTVDEHADAFRSAGFATVDVLDIRGDLALWRAVAPTDPTA
jgi:SAM-dependent methyltransferase